MVRKFQIPQKMRIASLRLFVRQSAALPIHTHTPCSVTVGTTTGWNHCAIQPSLQNSMASGSPWQRFLRELKVEDLLGSGTTEELKVDMLTRIAFLR